MKTGFTSVKLALAGFVVPYMFVYNQRLMLSDVTLLSGIQVCITACLGAALIALAAEGYLFTRASWPVRIISFATALLLIDSAWLTDMIGLVLGLLLFLFQRVKQQREKRSASAA